MRTIIPQNAKLVPDNAECVFKGRIFVVYQWQQEMFDGSSETFEMLKRPDTIKVIAINDNKVVTLEEAQPDDDRTFTGLPGGRHDIETETELEAAKREVLEETGMTFKSWRLIGVEQPYLKMDWFIYFFLATDFDKQQEQKLDAGEKIEVKQLSLDEIKSRLGSEQARYLPKEIFEQCANLQDLLELPEYKH